MDDEPPNLSLVSQNDPAELAEREELEATNWIIRRYTANLLRVMRGAGRPHELLSDLNELVKTIRATEHVSVWRFNEHFAEVLRDALRQHPDERGVANARTTITRGVLQMLASELAGHLTQKRRGESEISEGVQEMTSAWEESRRKFREEMEAQRAVLALDRARSALRRRPNKKPPTKPKESAGQVAEIEHSGSTAEFMKKRAAQLAKRRDG